MTAAAGDTPAAVRVLDVPFADLAFDEAVAWVEAHRAGPVTAHLVLANAHTLNLAARDGAYRAVLQRAALVLRDGVGVELASRFAGRHLRHNFVGTDFVPALLGALAAPVRVFLYGGRPGVAERAGRALGVRCPAVRVVGATDGFAPDPGLAARIAGRAPDVLLVALGNPLQERWIDAHAARLGGGVAVGVGALLDYLAGDVPRAPRWLRDLRSEWLYRLACEPRRLWRRYVLGNPAFVWRVLARRDLPTMVGPAPSRPPAPATEHAA